MYLVFNFHIDIFFITLIKTMVHDLFDLMTCTHIEPISTMFKRIFNKRFSQFNGKIYSYFLLCTKPRTADARLFVVGCLPPYREMIISNRLLQLEVTFNERIYIWWQWQHISWFAIDYNSSTRNSLCLCERRHKSIDIECSHLSTSVHTYGLVFNTNVMCRHFICLEELITKYC